MSKNHNTQPVRQTRSFLSVNWRTYLAVGAVAALVDMLLGLGVQPGEGNLAQTVWLAIVFTAFLWLTSRLEDKRVKKVALREVFYDGSSAFVKQVLVILFWSLCWLPFLIWQIMVFELVMLASFGASTFEVLAVSAASLLLAVLGVFLVTRTLFASVLVFELTPGKAISTSWRLSKRRVRYIAPRSVIVLVLMMLPLGLLQYLTAGGVLTNPVMIKLLELTGEALVFVLVLPVMSVLIHKLYKHEKLFKPRPKTKK